MIYPLKTFLEGTMARLKKKRFDHETSLKNIKKNSPSERLLRDEGSTYLYIH